MKRKNTMDLLKENCLEENIDLFIQFQEEIKDFFYKYDLFNCDNMNTKIFECLNSKSYMSYAKISEYAAINIKGVIKFMEKYENFISKMLSLPKYEKLKNLIIIK